MRVFVMYPESEAFEEEVKDLLDRYGLEDGGEYIIIPYVDSEGKQKRIFLLKRRYIRIVHGEDHFIDYPLAEVIEALVHYPEGHLKETMHLFHKEHVDSVEKEVLEEHQDDDNNGDRA